MFSTFSSLFLALLFSPPCIPARPSHMFEAKPVITEKNYTYTWHEFERFLDLERGSHIIGISELKKYFHRFGYLPQKYTNFTDKFDIRFEHAITQYQFKHGLEVTGKLNSDTLSQIMSPRCGVPDSLHGVHATRKYVYFTGQPRWAREIPMTLTYAFSPNDSITYLSTFDIREAFGRAFSRWGSVIPVKFTEIVDYPFADIKIGFYHGDHGDEEAFDGVLGVLAHAFSPESGLFHLDAAETWAVDFNTEKSGAAVHLESVATHEIGHILGLAHTSVKEAIMYPSLRPREKKLDLKVDDIKGIQALYGSNPNYRFGALSERDTSSNYAHDLRVGSSGWTNLLLILILWL